MDFDALTLSLDNPIMTDPLVAQNIKLTDEVLKIILIGDENVGKSLLIEKLINTGNPLLHTSSLEIKKKRIKLLERILTLEFWDTNKKILCSKLSESIIVNLSVL
jgi:GTPase SAR1 family protein